MRLHLVNQIPSISISNDAWLKLNDKTRLHRNIQFMRLSYLYNKLSNEDSFNVEGATKIWIDACNNFKDLLIESSDLLESFPDQDDKFVTNFKRKLLHFRTKMNMMTNKLLQNRKIIIKSIAMKDGS